jgi:hypothetical protein
LLFNRVVARASSTSWDLGEHYLLLVARALLRFRHRGVFLSLPVASYRIQACCGAHGVAWVTRSLQVEQPRFQSLSAAQRRNAIEEAPSSVVSASASHRNLQRWVDRDRKKTM